MAFDGIVTKVIASELSQLSGARIDKIFEPNKNTIILGFYLDGTNYALNICTDVQNYRIHLTTHQKQNPQVAPNFCMVLRKHLIGLRIKNVITTNLERVVIIEFEGFDDVDDIITKKLVVELMGKHCNIILVNENNIIIDSLRHIYSDEENFRNIVPQSKYIFPATDKINFLDLKDFSEFKKYISDIKNTSNVSSCISNTFNGISKSFIEYIISNLDISVDILDDEILNKIYENIRLIIDNTDTLNLKFNTFTNKSKKGVKDFALVYSKDYTNFDLNFFIDDFYFEKETSLEFKTYRDSVLKYILDAFKRYQKRLLNMEQKLQECENMETYRLYGELITSNLYRIPNQNSEEICLENYYDNNKKIVIPLDKKYIPSINAKNFFKKYSKLKNTLEIVSVQKQETIDELNYIESIIYELEASSSIDDVYQIFEEISNNVVFKSLSDDYKDKKNRKVKKSKLTTNKNVSFNPIKYKINNYTFLVGKNNTQNDYLTLKYAKKTDLWFHTKDIHGSHCILILEDNKIPDDDILIRCAQIASFHSKAKNSSNVPVDVCEVKYVKKPNGSKPGMVIYTNNRTLNVNPKNN